MNDNFYRLVAPSELYTVLMGLPDGKNCLT